MIKSDPAAVQSAAERGGEGPEGVDEAPRALWPSADYFRQVERLTAAVGETVYVAELNDSATQLGVCITDAPFVLLGVIDFPRPDPARGLAPHLIVLDDGRGVNLGRIARITCGRAFDPAPADVLYRDARASRQLLHGERRLTQGFIARRSRTVLGQVLGTPDDRRASGKAEALAPSSASAEADRES